MNRGSRMSMAACNGQAAFGIRTKRLKTIDTVIKQPLRPICGDWFKKNKKKNGKQSE